MLQGNLEDAAVNALEWLGDIGFLALCGDAQRTQHVQPNRGWEFFKVFSRGLEPLNCSRVSYLRNVDKFVNGRKA